MRFIKCCEGEKRVASQSPAFSGEPDSGSTSLLRANPDPGVDPFSSSAAIARATRAELRGE